MPQSVYASCSPVQVSDPDSAAYGQHLTVDAVNELVRPTEESASAVAVFLADSGVDMAASCRPNGNGDLIKCTLPVSQVETMLGAKYDTIESAVHFCVQRALV